jgi:hypothetical protein
MNLWITMDNPSWYTPDLRGSSTANLTNGPNVQIQMIQRSCQVHIVNVAYTKDPAAICWDSPSICDDKLSMRTTQASQNHGETWSDLELPVPPAKHTLYMNIYEQISSCKMQADAEGSHGFLEACTNQCRFNRFALHLTSTHCNLPGQRRKCKNVKHSRSLLIVCWLWVRQSPKWWVPCATPCFGPLAFRSLRQARSQWCCDFRWTAPSKLEQTFGGRQPFPPPTPQNLHMWAPYIHIICLLNRKNGCVKHLFGLAMFFGCMFAVHAMRKRAFRWMCVCVLVWIEKVLFVPSRSEAVQKAGQKERLGDKSTCQTCWLDFDIFCDLYFLLMWPNVALFEFVFQSIPDCISPPLKTTVEQQMHLEFGNRWYCMAQSLTRRLQGVHHQAQRFFNTPSRSGMPTKIYSQDSARRFKNTQKRRKCKLLSKDKYSKDHQGCIGKV